MKLEQLQLLHRLTGFIVILYLLLLAITGILLNHAAQLDLDKKFITREWLLRFYAIGPREPPVAYTDAGSWLTLIDDRLYFNERELPLRSAALLGLVKLDEAYVAALPDALLLLTADGDIIEKITALNGLPDAPQKLGKRNAELFIISTPNGSYGNTARIGAWHNVTPGDETWSSPEPLPESLRQRLLSLYRGSGLSMERVLLDLHSGRILGRGRIIIVDMVAALLILSALSGVSMWYKKRKMLIALNKK